MFEMIYVMENMHAALLQKLTKQKGEELYS